MSTTVLPVDSQTISRTIPLSYSSASPRIDEMSDDIESSLCDELCSIEFALELDESTVRDNEALLLAHVAFIKGSQAQEEMLFCRRLKTHSTAKDIYEELKSYLDIKNIPMHNIRVACHRWSTCYVRLSQRRSFFDEARHSECVCLPLCNSPPASCRQKPHPTAQCGAFISSAVRQQNQRSQTIEWQIISISVSWRWWRRPASALFYWYTLAVEGRLFAAFIDFV